MKLRPPPLALRFDAAQPALLYLVPSCLGAALAVALARGELRDLLAYDEEEAEEGADEADAAAEGAARAAEAKKTQ